MSILVIGINHRSGPVSVLERVALAADEVPKAVGRLASRDNVREVVLISTCNRTEVYAVTERFHGAYADIRDFLCEVGDISAGRAASAPLLAPRRCRRPPPVRGRGRARLGGRRRVRDPRPGPPGVGDRPGRGRRASDDEPALPPRAGGRQAGPHRDRHRAGHDLGQPRRGRDGGRAPRRSRRAPGRGRRRRRDGRGDRARAAAGGRPGVRRQPHAASVATRWRNESPARRSGSISLYEVLVASDVVITSTGAGRPLVTAELGTHRHRGPRRPAVAVRRHRRAARRRAPRCARSPVSPCSTSTTSARGPNAGWPCGRPRSSTCAAIVSEEVDRFAVASTSLQAAPLVGALRERAEEVRAGRAAPLRRASWRVSTTSSASWST